MPGEPARSREGSSMATKAPTRAKRLATKLGAQMRWHPEQDHTDLIRESRAETLADHIRRVVDTAPGITREQAERLAGLLRPGGTK